MSIHSQIQSQLYEYLESELGPEAREAVRDHLAACPACAREAEELRSIREMTRARIGAPSTTRSEEYWSRFADQVDGRLRLAVRRRKSPLELFSEWLVTLVRFRPQTAYASGVAIVLIIVGGLYLLRRTGQDLREAPAQTVSEVPSPGSANGDPRMADYFRKSKVLLVGLTNMKAGEPVDLTLEQQTSRDLIHQARYLRTQPMDIRSARLIGDLEKILIELSNLKEDGGAPNVEIIRAGIHQENLLFKIRMAESRYDSTSSTF